MRRSFIPRRAKARSHLAVTNPIALAYMPDDQVAINIARFLRDASPAELRQHLPRLCSEPKTGRNFAANASTLGALASAKYYRLSTDKLLSLFSSLLATHRERLIAFLAERRRFETAILTGNYEKAERHITDITTRLGDSLWGVRAKILLLHMQGRSEEMQEYAQSCRDELGQTFASYLTNSFLVVTANPQLHLNKTVRATVKEFTNANHNEWADLVTLALVPQGPGTEPCRLNCLSTLQLFPAVDLFIFMKGLLTHNGALSPSSLSPGEARLLEQLQQTELAARQAAGFSTTFSSSSFISIFESGNYEAFITTAERDLHAQWRPASAANLIAKSAAILGRLREVKSPLAAFISHLQDLYSLVGQPKSTESEVASLIAILGFFSDSFDLQHCVIKAMPHRFAAPGRCWSARRNELFYGDCTHWDKALSREPDPLLSHTYYVSEAKLTESRRIKEQMKSHLERGHSSKTELLRLMGEYRRRAPLARDHHELFASTLLRVGDLDLLVEGCSSVLASTPNAYTAFPMEQIVGHIENNHIATLDAVVACYFYAKYVDKRKEYVLNEVYEEFLLSNDAGTPSDLLTRPSFTHDRRFDLLLLHVSTLETMDFLGCFDSSSALSAERVRILDYLRERGKISLEAHRSEVDEIVNKVVVDTTATEFNVAKIDVNDDAIRRHIHDDVASLLAVYKTHDKERPDRLITLDQESSGGSEPLAMVVGDKGTALHKLMHLITSAFVGDEKHGLARNLSAEVRHGFFSNQMRARLEEAKLLTERDSEGQYQRNQHWLDHYDFVADEILAAVDEELRWFSAAFNEVIRTAEEWMKIAMVPTDNKSRVFRFGSMPLSALDEIRAAADTGDADLVIDRALEMLWRVTEEASAELRNRINTHLRHDVDQLLNELAIRIEAARGGAPLVDLTEALQACRGGLHEDLTAISEWFKRTNSAVVDERTVPDLIRVSVECLNRVRGSQISPTLLIQPCVGRSLRFARDVRCFIIALVNLLENAIRHSGFGLSTPLFIETQGGSMQWSLKVSNEVTAERLADLRGGTLAMARERMEEAGATRVQSEGGSGLTKVISHLKSIDDRYHLAIRLEENRFCAEIGYDDTSIG